MVARAGLLIAMLAAVLLAAGPGRATSPEQSSARAESYTFAFDNADISEVAKAILGDTLGLTYTVDPAVTGKMSFRIERRMSGAELLAAFEAALETNDVVMIREGDSITLKPRAKAKGAGGVHTLAEGIHGAGYQTVAVPLAYAAPSEVAKAVQATGREDMVVYVDDKQGILILGGTGPELEDAVELVKTFDHSGLEDSKIRFFELQEAPAETVAGDLSHVLEASDIPGVTVVPLKRMNGLFVFARTPEALDEVGKWVVRLDTASKEKGPTLWVYHPKNATADALAATLDSALTGQAPPTTSTTAGGAASLTLTGGVPSAMTGSTPQVLTPGLGPQPMLQPAPPAPPLASAQAAPTTLPIGPVDDPVRIGVDKEANSLLVFASPSRWLDIQRILDQIDQPPAQIMIDASILEVTLTNQFNFGVDWSIMGDNGRASASAIYSPSGTVSSSTPGFSVTFLSHGIQAAVNALGQKTTVEVVSSPKIVALDNHTAKLDIGDQVPILTQTAQNTTAADTPIISSVSYQNTGVILSVTPRISGDNRIYLDIDQEVSDVAQTTTSGINSPTIEQRELATTLILDNGGTVALGGLISANRTRGSAGFPGLMNVPVLGNMFKDQNKTLNRTELIVLLSARIIRNQADAKSTLTTMLADMKDLERDGFVRPNIH